MKTVLMIVANNGFQDHEFGATFDALNSEDIQITIAAKRKGDCFGVFGKKIEATHNLEELHGNDFDMVIFIGGGGTLNQYIHNQNYLRIAKESKKLGAICIAPMIVSESGVFNEKNVTSRDEDGIQQKFIEKNGGNWIKQPVIRDNNIITANGPEAAEDFGKECLKLLQE